MVSEQKGDYCVTLDYEKGHEDPPRVFRAMSEAIGAFQAFDLTLVRTIDISVRPVLVLEEIEAGSIKAWLKNVLRDIDDEDLAKLDWKAILGKFLVKAKHRTVEWLEDKDEITSRNQIKVLEGEIQTIAEQIGLNPLPFYSPIPPQILFENLRQISDALTLLSHGDRILYSSPDGELVVNSKFRIDPARIEELLTKETLIHESEMILKVKKPDYLGHSMWVFRHDNHAIDGKIIDEEWLVRFQGREIDVRPGDSLRARVRLSVKYGFDSSVVGTHYELLTVYEVIPQNIWRQDSI